MKDQVTEVYEKLLFFPRKENCHVSGLTNAWKILTKIRISEIPKKELGQGSLNIVLWKLSKEFCDNWTVNPYIST